MPRRGLITSSISRNLQRRRRDFSCQCLLQAPLQVPFATKSLVVFVLTLSLVLPGCSLLRSVGLLPKKEAAAVAEAPVPLSEQPYEFSVLVQAADDVNRDTNQTPSPIRTRIFLTEPDTAFTVGDFEKIFEFAGASVEPAPVATITLQPGEQKRIKLNAMKSQNLLTIAAAYRDPYSVDWLATKSINPETVVRLNVEINATAVEFVAP